MTRLADRVRAAAARTHVALTGRSVGSPRGRAFAMSGGHGYIPSTHVEQIAESKGWSLDASGLDHLDRFTQPPHLNTVGIGTQQYLAMSALGSSTPNEFADASGLAYVGQRGLRSVGKRRMHLFTGDAAAVERMWWRLWLQSMRCQEPTRGVRP